MLLICVCVYSGWLSRDCSFKELNTMNLHLCGNYAKKEIDFIFVSNTKEGNAYKHCRIQMGTVFLFLFHYGLCLLHDPFACLCVWVCISVCVCVCVKGVLIVVLYKPFAAECICFHGYPHANVDHVITRPDLCSYCLLIVEEKTECVFGF